MALPFLATITISLRNSLTFFGTPNVTWNWIAIRSCFLHSTAFDILPEFSSTQSNIVSGNSQSFFIFSNLVSNETFPLFPISSSNGGVSTGWFDAWFSWSVRVSNLILQWKLFLLGVLSCFYFYFCFFH